MAVTDRTVLTGELRIEVQEFYFRYAECLDAGRLRNWPEFFLDSCTYRVTTRRGLRMGPQEDLISIGTTTSMRDRIVAIGRSEDYEPHSQRHYISNFRIQSASEDELRVQANFQILRTFPERPTEFFLSGYYLDRVAVSVSRLHFREKLCVLDSHAPPDSLVHPI
ncbi:MAG TPA: nuclear transport factor 2 family protein [Burkholderiales bacterium]